MRCNESELPNGLFDALAAVVPVEAMFPMVTAPASASGKFCQYLMLATAPPSKPSMSVRTFLVIVFAI